MSWRDDAACKDRADLFFPPSCGENAEARSERLTDARALCSGCPVRADCLTFAIGRDTTFGVWGSVDFGDARRRQQAVREAAAA